MTRQPRPILAYLAYKEDRPIGDSERRMHVAVNSCGFIKQGRIHGSISRVRVGRGSIVVGQGQ